jgi:molybdate transport system substrate-binding protein
LALTATLPAQAQGETVTVYAAVSMKNALDDLNAAFSQSTGIKVVLNLAASPALAKAIEGGVLVDVFASADLDWMDYLDKKKLLKDDSRSNLLGNRLVLIAPKDSKLGNVTIGQDFDIARLVGDGRIAVADVLAVPAGKYAKAALQKLGGWAAAEHKLTEARNVRAALEMVGRGEASLGIVYETDAKVEPRVKIVGHFPEDSHPAIIYPVALTATAKPEALNYIAFMRSNAAKMIFEKYGFIHLPDQADVVIFARVISAWGQLHAFPRRSIAVCFTPVSGIDSRSQALPGRARSGRMQRSKQHLYSITLSARASSIGGTSSPSARAVLRLMTSSYLVGACTGRSAGFSPLRMRST